MKFLLATIILVTAFTTNVQARSIMPSQFEVISASLNKKAFDFENHIIRFNKNGDTVYLRILNDICPNRPGFPSCRAMAMIAFDGVFTLSARIEPDSCNSKVQKSNVISYNGKKAQIVFKDMTVSTCDLVTLADYSLELIVKDEKGVKSTSYITISNLR